MDPRSPTTGLFEAEGSAAQACRSDIAAGYQSGVYRGFLYGAMFVIGVWACSIFI